jgi:hypothetical protein
MIRFFAPCFLTTILILGSATASLAADADSVLTDTQSAPSIRHGGNNPLVAGLLAWVVPSAGHRYAGDWRSSTFFVATEAIALGAIVVGSQMKGKKPCATCERRDSNLGESIVSVGTAYLVAGRIAEILDAAFLASGAYDATVTLSDDSRPTVTLAVHF